VKVLMGAAIVENIKHINFTIKYQGKALTIRLPAQDKATESLVRENLLLIRDTLIRKTNAIDSVKFWGQNNFVLIAFTFWNDAAIEYFEHLSDAYVAKRFFNDNTERSREFIEYIENTLGIRSFYGNEHPEIRNRIKDIYYQSYRREGIRNIANCMKKRQTLVEMVNIVDFLILNKEKLDLKSPVPVNNCFAHVSFHNVDNMRKHTDIIPDKVADAIYSEIEYLNPRFRLMYRIFMNTGLRLKEVVYLTADCLEPTQYENVKYLRYIPYKVLSARRRRGLPDYKKIPVPQYLADEIQQRIEESEGLREEYQSQYIFINKAKGCTVAVPHGRNFSAAVNRLISKYGIKDDTGSIWNFSSRQLRKTLVSEMIENGATTTEVAYWLGHMSERTTREYYEEIKKMKLADLNAEFFSREFDVVMKKEHADKFSPEEKRALYIDFKLNYRRVELGYCMKHYSESPCSNLSGRTKCAVCPNLCTGRKYLKEWLELLNSQKGIVKELEGLYASKNIGDYTEFKEYQIEIYLLNIYQNVVDMIEKEGICK